MGNTPTVAKRWIAFLAVRPEVPWGARLIDVFDQSKITRLCDCGCNSFDVTVPEEADVKPIAFAGGYGSIFEISFEAKGDGPPSETGSLEFFSFADTRGHFAGIKIDFCGNSYPIPESIVVANTPHYVSAGDTINA